MWGFLCSFYFFWLKLLMRFYYASYSLHSFHWECRKKSLVSVGRLLYALSMSTGWRPELCKLCQISLFVLCTFIDNQNPPLLEKKTKEKQGCRMWGGGQIPIAYLFTDEMMAIWNRSPISWLVYKTKLRFWLKKNKYISNHKKAENSKNKVTFNLKVNKYVLQNVRWRSSNCAFWDWKFDTTF